MRSIQSTSIFSLVVLVTMGCAGYRFGSRNLFAPHIHSVHVPVFQSESFRPYLAQLLTEAVVKEIELTSGMKVVAANRAESVLEGRILNDAKRVLVENINDQPRDIQVSLLVEVQWRTAQGQPIRSDIVVPVPAALVQATNTSNLVPEVGHSLATAEVKVIQKLAREIVAMMEVPW